jgi:phi LC3 family holin
MVNVKVRLKNPVFLVTFITAIIAFIYQILGMFDVVPAVSEDSVVQVVGIVINILTAMGILVDPTTKGIGDSQRALNYDEPQ